MSDSIISEKSRAWIELDLEALRHNVAWLRTRLPKGCELMPAIKSNAYGHGALIIADELVRLGVDAFCTATAEEGAELRRHGIPGTILVLGYTHPAQFDLLDNYNLTQTVVDHEYAKALSAYGKKLSVHIAIDTGMHRLGEKQENFDRICAIFRMENLRIDGIFTHLCSADSETVTGKRLAMAQAQTFYHTIGKLSQAGFTAPKIHLLSSYGLINYSTFGGDYARVGIALYGVLSSGSDTAVKSVDLRPVLSLKARISSVRCIGKGEGAGYGPDFKAKRDSKIAALAIGYADGLPRALSSGVGHVLINGHKAPIAGRICMDQTLVDVTDIPDVSPGDTAVFIGTSGDLSISAYDIAEQAGTITNEILSRMGTRLGRIAK